MIPKKDIAALIALAVIVTVGAVIFFVIIIGDWAK